MNSFGEKVGFIWGVADLVHDTFKRGKDQDVILPFTVIRRLDCVLQRSKTEVMRVNAKLTGKLENVDPELRRAFDQATPGDYRGDPPGWPGGVEIIGCRWTLLKPTGP